MKTDGALFYESEEIIVLYYSFYMGKKRDTCMVFVGKPEKRGHLNHLSIDRRIILKCIGK
jgi:hypothetical protein